MSPIHDAGFTPQGGPTPPSDVMETLERYLDGALSADERAAFERLLDTDAGLRRHVDAHRAISASLRSRMAPPATITFPALEAAAEDRAAPAPIPISRAGTGAGVGRWIGYAAAALIGVVGVVWYSSTVPNPSARPVLTAGEVLAATIKGGFTPVFVCKDDAEFVATVKKRFGEGLLVTSSDSIAVLGWAYSDTYGSDLISKDTLVLMARVEGREVLVFMDRAPGVHTLKAGDVPNGYRLFKRVIGGLVLYELTPFDTARVLDEARPAG